MARKPFNFPDLVSAGENPNGFRALSPNGVRTGEGDDYEKQWNPAPGIDGPRWNPVEDVLPTLMLGAPRRRK